MHLLCNRSPSACSLEQPLKTGWVIIAYKKPMLDRFWFLLIWSKSNLILKNDRDLLVLICTLVSYRNSITKSLRIVKPKPTRLWIALILFAASLADFAVCCACSQLLPSQKMKFYSFLTVKLVFWFLQNVQFELWMPAVPYRLSEKGGKRDEQMRIVGPAASCSWFLVIK